MRNPYTNFGLVFFLAGLPLASAQSTQPALLDSPKVSSTGTPRGQTLQEILDQPATVINVPYGEYELDAPLFVRSNRTVRFAPGTRVLAAPGAFKGVEDSMIVIAGVSDVVFEAYECTFKMRKNDYRNLEQYSPSQWRHVMTIRGSKNVSILGGRYESSGGDGIYIGPLVILGVERRPCDSVSIIGVTCHDNWRQGISVLAATNSIIVDSVFSGTVGTSPQAGIDIEPEYGDSVDLVVRKCISKGNRGAAFMMNLSHVTPARYIRISFEGCVPVGVPPDQFEFKTIGVFNEWGRLEDHLPIGTYIAWNGLMWTKRN